MRLLYIANIRLPTEKAHGYQIMKMCEAFVRQGCEVELVVPTRRTSSVATQDVHAYYAVKSNFQIRRLFTPDVVYLGKFGFLASALYFSESARWLSVFWNVDVIYSRDAFILAQYLLLSRAYVYEAHMRPAWLSSLVARHARLVVVTTQALRVAYTKVGVNPKRILVAPSGVDLSVFDNASTKGAAREVLEIPQEERLCVFTGNFTTLGEDKGIKDMLVALQSLPEVYFIAVGGSEADIVRYTQLAEEYKVRDRVSLRPRVTPKELAVYQKAADVLVMPFPDRPHYREAMSPLKLFEYMAAERPILATDLPTIREVLDDKVAYLVPPDKPSAIVEAIQNIYANPAEAAARAQEAHRQVVRYTWETRARSIVSNISHAKD